MASRDRDDAAVDLVHTYLNEIGQHRLLSADDERALGRQVRAGLNAEAEMEAFLRSPDEIRRLEETARRGQAAQREFIQANLRLVVSIAKRYVRLGYALLDLVQDGNEGLMRAVIRFDPERGFKFSTYATWWIRQGIERKLPETGKSMRLPSQADELARTARQAAVVFEECEGRKPADEEIAAILGVPTAKVTAVLVASSEPMCLDMPYGDTGVSLYDTLGDSSADTEAEALVSLIAQDQALEIDALLGSLNDSERAAVGARFDLTGRSGELVPYALVAQAIGQDAETARNLTRRALLKMRRQAQGGRPVSSGRRTGAPSRL